MTNRPTWGHWAVLLLLLALPVVTRGETGVTRHLTITVEGAKPHTPVYLSLNFMRDPLRQYDAWEEAPGRYHVDIDSAPQGYYSLVFGINEFTLTFPLFGSGTELELTTSVSDPLGDAHMSGAPEAEAYFTLLREHRLLEDAEWGLGALQRMIGEDPSLLQAQVHVDEHFYKTIAPIIEDTKRHYPSSVVSLYYMPNKGLKGFEKWWPEGWFTYPLVTLDPEFPNYVRRFFRSHYSEEYSYTRQLKVYASLLRQFVAYPRSEINHFALQSVLVDLFKGNVYDALLDSMGRYGLYPDTLFRAEQREPERLLKMKRKDLTGNTVQLVDRKARYTLVVLWSENCSHCQALMPRLWEVCKAHLGKELAVRAIAIDPDMPELRSHILGRNWGWTNLVEPDDGTSPLLEALNGDGTPALFLLDAKGHLLARPENEKQLAAELQERQK